MIEKGRHMRPRIERSVRKCFLCVNEIENEIHFITQCPLFAQERKKIIMPVWKMQKISNKFPQLTKIYFYSLKRK